MVGSGIASSPLIIFSAPFRVSFAHAPRIIAVAHIGRLAVVSIKSLLEKQM